MKVGILTFQFADNYGALLQAYALRSYLKETWNCDVEIINYANDALEHAYSINPLKYKGLRKKIIAIIKYPYRKIIRAKFDSFRFNQLGIAGSYRKDIDCSLYSVLIVGSDQVWNRSITHNDMAYFIQDHLVNEDAHTYYCSYAASANNSFLDNITKEVCSDLLKKFDAISVREEKLHLELWERYGQKNELVCDPVLLLPREAWDKLAGQKIMKKRPYIIMYSLKKSERLENISRELCKKTGYELLLVHPLGQRCSSIGKLTWGIGPMEFVSLIKNAEYVVSNSFHAFAFSTLYSKCIFFEYIEGLSSRVESLIKNIDIKYSETQIDGVYYAELNSYNSEKYSEFVQSSKDYLQRVNNARIENEYIKEEKND